MYTKAEVNFEHPATGMNHCGECTYFLGGRCAIVVGVVQPGDWCKKFAKESMKTNDTEMAEGREAESPAEENAEQSEDHEALRKAADARSSHPGQGIKEHGLHVISRTTGKSVEIGFGPQGGGLVPKNPFASLAQEGYLHAHPEKLGKKKLAEFDAATKGMKLPKHVKKSK
jgi:hypothetical protein